MKLVIVGGSAHSTPALADTAAIKDVLGCLNVVLVGRSAERLNAVSRAMRALVHPQKLRVSTASTKSAIDTAFLGADLILIQARYGGYAARDHDERLPLAYGVPGDEGLGPGGLASAWRSWPHVDRLLELAASNAPHSDIVLLTAPLGILARCALTQFPQLRLVGLCELPRITLDRICTRAGVDKQDVRYSYAGVNHLGWFDALETPESDVIKTFAQTCDDVSFPDRALVEHLHAVPLSYMRLHYRRDDVVAKQRAAKRSRAEELKRLASDAFAVFAGGDAGAIRSALARRQTPWYSYAVGPYIAGRCGARSDDPFFLTTANDGYLEGIASSEVLEIPFVMKNGRHIRIERLAELREPMLSDLKKLVAYEGLAASAVLERSREGLTEALTRHPWVDHWVDADALASAIHRSSDDRAAAVAG